VGGRGREPGRHRRGGRVRHDFPPASAVYATTGLTLAKSATESSFTLPGDTLHYSYLVTNNGFAPLQGPVSVSDDKATVTCPAVTTVGDLDNYLDPGEAITCTATYIVTPGDVTAASVTNTATPRATACALVIDGRGASPGCLSQACTTIRK